MYRKIILNPVAILYGFIVQLRNVFYDKKLLKVNRLPCKVISVGNITMGGTGKTPIVIYLSNLLKERGYKTAIISRGYKRNTTGTVLVSDGIEVLSKWEDVGDEPYMMAKKLKNIPIVVDENRFRGGLLLIREFDPDIILLDDGFQHRKLHRDLDIVLLNGKDDYVKHHLLPYGTFREPWSSLLRADIIFTTKQKPTVHLSIKIKYTSLPLICTKNAYSVNSKSRVRQNDVLKFKNKKVFLYCGIADPISFKKAVLEMQYLVCGSKFFPDHFHYSKKDIREIEILARNNDADLIVTTEKDWVKTKEHEPEFDVAVVSLLMEPIEKSKFNRLLKSFSI